MLFNSNLFIFAFLPVVLFAVVLFSKFSINKNATIAVVIFASLLFYSHHNIPNLVVIIFSTVSNYGFYLILGKYNKKFIIFLAVLLNLLILSYFKYTNFIIESVNLSLSLKISHVDITLPLAISFFTFQQISFLVENFRYRTANVNFLKYMLYITFFPQLIAGPIVRFSEFFPQLDNFTKSNRIMENFSVGISIFALGLFKKIVIADKAGIVADSVFSAVGTDDLTFIPAWLGLVAYSLQIYFDFSGYSDMAVGLARLFGIKLPINFNSPYQATSIIDFWRRWHISLSFFLRDYVYKPIGGSQFGNLSFARNIFFTMLIAGLWHGAGWTFILWGALHGSLLICNHLARRFMPISSNANIMKMILTYLFVTVAWVPFRATDLNSTIIYFKALFGFQGLALPTFLYPYISEYLIWLGIESIKFKSVGFIHVMNMGYHIYGVIPLLVGLVIVFRFPNVYNIFRRYQPVFSSRRQDLVPARLKFLIWRPNLLWSFIVFFAFVAAITLQGKPNEFLYFQF